MNFAARIIRLPRAHDPDLGAEARACLPGVAGDVAALLDGAGGSSPHLKSLIEQEADWLGPALDAPEAAADQALADLREVAPDRLGPALRQAKRRIALITALADLAGVWPLEEVTGRLTRLADLACQCALQATVGTEIRRGKLPGASEADIPQAGGLVALAMGKMGAEELNYSSDIDLICLVDETRYDASDFSQARASLIRATRRMAALLSDITDDGYVFRTDLRLRPDPAVTPVCLAMAAAETYYESLGRTWERAAYIKARPAAGDVTAGARFLQVLRPFVWRKHLDFAAIQDAHDMRLRIREHKGVGGPITLAGHDMKLGRGGIREIEFFTQTRQLISGGRDPSLRLRGTVPALAALAAKGWVGAAEAERLTGHYRAHREVEHRLQMVHDAQTHRLPRSPENMTRLAALMGRDRAELEADLRARLQEVHELTEGFFAPDAADPRVTPGPGGHDSKGDQAEDAAAAIDPEIVRRWRNYPALRSERAVAIFRRLRPDIMARLAQADNSHEALLAFDGFLAGLPAGVQLFSLFEANPQLIDLLVDIVGTSPDLGRYLARNSAVFDAVIAGDFFADWPGAAALTTELANRLAAEPDYERQLDLTRRWGKEWHFRIGVHVLRGLIDPERAGRHYADLAQATLAALLPQVCAHFALKHGAPPGRGAVVLGMGSLGAGWLTATSDLDLIVIYDPDGAEASDGRRPLNVRTYYARLTQALVTAMTAPMAEGRLYEVDMRLRPSGNQGPVATSWQAFRDYQQEQAWLWEHLALTRARVVAGDAALARDVTRFRRELLARPRVAADVLAEVAHMRARIEAAKGAGSPWEVKTGPGRMQDIDLIAQAGLLLGGDGGHDIPDGLDALEKLGLITAAAVDRMKNAHVFYRDLQLAMRLLGAASGAPDQLGQGGRALICRVTGSDDIDALRGRLEEIARDVAATIDALLPAPKPEEDAR